MWQRCHSISLRLTGSDKARRQKKKKKREHPGNRRTGAALVMSLEGTLSLSIRLPVHLMPHSDPHWCENGRADSGISMCVHTWCVHLLIHCVIPVCGHACVFLNYILMLPPPPPPTPTPLHTAIPHVLLPSSPPQELTAPWWERTEAL